MKESAKCVTLSFAVTTKEAEEFERILGAFEYHVSRSSVLRKAFLDWLDKRRQKPVGDENRQG